MAICDNWKRITSIVHGVTTLAQPTGGSIRATVDWIENNPDVVVTPTCIAVDKFRCEADAEFQGIATPISIGTSGTLTYTCQNFAGASTGNIALSTMLASAPSWDFNSAPFKQKQEFKYQGSSQAPWTVTPV